MNVEITDVKVHEAGHLKVKEVTFTEQGNIVSRSYLWRGIFVAALVYDRTTEKFLFVRQVRIPATETQENPILEEVVAGLHDQETFTQTLKKEIEEELGIPEAGIVRVDFVTRTFPSPGDSSALGYLYYVEVRTEGIEIPQFGGRQDEHEYLERVNYSFTELIDLVSSGHFIDGKTYTLLMWWFANRASAGEIQSYRQYR